MRNSEELCLCTLTMNQTVEHLCLAEGNLSLPLSRLPKMEVVVLLTICLLLLWLIHVHMITDCHATTCLPGVEPSPVVCYRRSDTSWPTPIHIRTRHRV